MDTHGLEKAFIEVKDTGAQIACRFNPKEYTIAKTAEWKKTPAKGAKSAPKVEFVGTNPGTLQMELFFDGWDSGSGDVSKDVDALLTLTKPTSTSLGKNKPMPPIIVFHWGTTSSFDAHVKSVNAKYTMFAPDGSPLRATVTLQCEEVPAEPGKQNPSSGGVQGRRTHMAGEGDTLHSVAFEEYGDPSLWRGLADVNGIDDPMRLAPGTSILIPPAPETAALS
jgi:nucleoid-associated protein YgaU